MAESAKEKQEKDCSDNNYHHEYKIPTKCVKNMEDVSIWEKSEAYQEYLGFIFVIGDSIKGKKIRDLNVEELDKEGVVVGILNVLGELDKWISEIPAVEQQQRFGNKAFREWHNRLEKVGK